MVQNFNDVRYCQARKKETNYKEEPEDYAGFILKNYFDDFVRELTRLFFEKKIPLLKYLNGMPPTQLDELAKHSKREFLIKITEKAKEYVKNSLKRWLSDQLPIIERDQVVLEDISLVSHTRKQIFMSFLPGAILMKEPVSDWRSAKRLLKNHSGVIVASGVPDQCATFEIIIPSEQP